MNVTEIVEHVLIVLDFAAKLVFGCTELANLLLNFSNVAVVSLDAHTMVFINPVNRFNFFHYVFFLHERRVGSGQRKRVRSNLIVGGLALLFSRW